MNKNGSCHLKILESVIENIKEFVDLNKNLVVIRSTVPPKTCSKLNCYFMPEFLTEKNYVNDFINNKDWIFGLKNSKQDTKFKKEITKLINLSYENKKLILIIFIL